MRVWEFGSHGDKLPSLEAPNELRHPPKYLSSSIVVKQVYERKIPSETERLTVLVAMIEL